MKSKVKPMITYITNSGKEKTFFVSRFNELIILKSIFEDSYDYTYYKKYELKSDIQYLEIKNYSFNKDTIEFNFSFDKNKILILDNCDFCNSLTIRDGGSVQLINPKFKRQKSEVKFCNLGDVDIEIDNDKVSSIISSDVRNFSLNGNNIFNGHIGIFDCRSSVLKNIRSSFLSNKDSYIYSDELVKIEDSMLRVDNIMVPVLDLCGTSLISTNEEEGLNLFVDQIIGNDFDIKTTGEKIEFKSMIIRNQNPGSVLSLTDEQLFEGTNELSRINLIYFLKCLKDEMLYDNKKYLYSLEQELKKKKVKTYRCFDTKLKD